MGPRPGEGARGGRPPGLGGRGGAEGAEGAPPPLAGGPGAASYLPSHQAINHSRAKCIGIKTNERPPFGSLTSADSSAEQRCSICVIEEGINL